MPKILLIGNPNVGKSTAFNSLTKSDEHTGNFHGVTVDSTSKKIHFENVEYVINLDMPEEPVYYQHRAGRTGRNGAKGTVVTVMAPFEKKLISRYEKTLGIKFEEKMMSYGKIRDIDQKQKELLDKKQAESKKKHIEKLKEAEKKKASEAKRKYSRYTAKEKGKKWLFYFPN